MDHDNDSRNDKDERDFPHLEFDVDAHEDFLDFSPDSFLDGKQHAAFKEFTDFLPPVDKECPSFEEIAKITGISLEEVEMVRVKALFFPTSLSRLLTDFFESVKVDYETTGYGFKHYILRFYRPADADMLESFKRAVTTRVSAIRREARIRSKVIIPEFKVAFLRLIPLDTDDPKGSVYVFCTLARMNAKQYRAHKRETVRASKLNGKCFGEYLAAVGEEL